MKQQSYFKKVGSYLLLNEIGSGSFARVFKGVHEDTKQEFAIKMINKENLRTENLSIIEKEIQILKKLDHPNVIKFYEHKITQNHYYLIFEFCEHGDLDHYIRKNTDNNRLPEQQVRTIVQQLAYAMQQMHSLRIVHRDLKLANILVNKNFQIKLADFGFAKYVEDNTFLISYCGTPLTMAPEILRREKYTDKCDIWSVGVIIYQMVCGKPPFLPPRGGNINDLLNVIQNQQLTFPDDVSNSLKDLLKQMLKKDYKSRMSCVQFYECNWLKECNQDMEYLKSINRGKDLSKEEPQPNHHKLSEDFTNQIEQIQSDLQQVEGISQGILGCCQEFLEQEIKEVQQIRLFAQKKYLSDKVQLSLKLYEALKIKTLYEFLKEQIVVLMTPSSKSELVTLNIKRPFEKYVCQVESWKNELQDLFSQQEKQLDKFRRNQLSVGDNILYNVIEMIQEYVEEDKVIKVDLDEVFRNIKNLVKEQPQERQIEIVIEMQNNGDMSQYWSVFKMIKGNFKEISEQIEDSINQNNGGNDKLNFRCQLDGEEKTISYSLESLEQLEEDLKKQQKQSSMLIIN